MVVVIVPQEGLFHNPDSPRLDQVVSCQAMITQDTNGTTGPSLDLDTGGMRLKGRQHDRDRSLGNDRVDKGMNGQLHQIAHGKMGQYPTPGRLQFLIAGTVSHVRQDQANATGFLLIPQENSSLIIVIQQAFQGSTTQTVHDKRMMNVSFHGTTNG